MPHQVRRVVTGHDPSGKAVIVSDGPAPFMHLNPHNPGWSSNDIWRTGECPAMIDAVPEEPTLGPRRQLPEKRGTVLRVNHFPPEPAEVRTMDSDTSRLAFAALGNADASTFGKSGRHPMMHRTQTIDYAIVLDGEITMLMDETEVELHAGDILIQCGTNHAWSNRSNAPCTVAFILVDGIFSDDVQARLASADDAQASHQ
jgi:mannose-6-phosphate isomerase-like protein (cupin superfamily)